jgi:hypothetical protein
MAVMVFKALLLVLQHIMVVVAQVAFQAVKIQVMTLLLAVLEAEASLHLMALETAQMALAVVAVAQVKMAQVKMQVVQAVLV